MSKSPSILLNQSGLLFWQPSGVENRHVRPYTLVSVNQAELS